MFESSEITPYTDSDVQPVLSEILKDDSFIDAMGKLQYKSWYAILRPFIKKRVRTYLQLKSSSIHSIRDFQLAIESQLVAILAKTTETLTVTGIDKLEPEQGYLYLSNHRDIAMDPALVNWALYNNGFDTVRIAIGDNLIKKSFVEHLMRLNKSFIVRRNLSKPREILQTYSELSSYIRHSICAGHSIWIAHREGRAKDAIDRTDPAILKMLSMSGRAESESFKDTIRALNVVPVSISYEFDPCAPMKARELAVKESEGYYTKKPDEDITSIATGIMGWKGRVHLHFGEPIHDIPNNPQELSQIIDRAIIQGQKIFDTSRIANSILEEQPDPDGVLTDVSTRFKTLVKQTPLKYRTKLLEIYANPLRQFAIQANTDL